MPLNRMGKSMNNFFEWLCFFLFIKKVMILYYNACFLFFFFFCFFFVCLFFFLVFSFSWFDFF